MGQYCRQFYMDLYTPEPTDLEATSTLLQSISTRPKLTQEDNDSLLAPISMEGLETLMDHSPRGRSPGQDGLPFELYFLLLTHRSTANLLLQVINDALAYGAFPKSWFHTTMVLLFKKGDTDLLANWRPLSLINCDAKLFTKLIGNRLRPCLTRLITPYQTGFVHGRFIADNGLALASIMDHCKAQRGHQVGLLLDQEKAYDRVHLDTFRALFKQWVFLKPLFYV